MKKRFRLLSIFSALALIVSLFGCAGKDQAPETTAPETTAPETTAPETTAEAFTRDPNVIPLVNPKVKEGSSISFLSIGHSMMVNATYYLYDFLKEAGYEKVEVAVLYYSGCSLEQHFNFYRKDEPAYRLYYNGKGDWTITEGYTMDMALRMKQWDYISFNTGAGASANPKTLEPYLTEVVNHVRKFQPNAHFLWNSLWAIRMDENMEEEYREHGKGMYSGTQQEMYEGIWETSKVVMQTHPEMEFMVPEGTAVQNMRTSKFGDGPLLVRDYAHLSYDYGYYLGALVLAKSIADIDIDASTFIPPKYADKFDEEIINGLKTAAKDAFADPWHVTENPYQ